jgi:hypothetical protein
VSCEVDTNPIEPKPATVDCRVAVDKNPAVWYPLWSPAVVEIRDAVLT